MSEMLNFVNAPNKSFFGLDKGESHSFTVPSNVKEQLIQYFSLGEGNLQTKIQLIIEKQEYSAEIRIGRIMNIRTYRTADRKIGSVLKIQWKKFPDTRMKIKTLFDTTREIVISGHKNKTDFAKFTHVGENKFLMTKYSIPTIF
jgi:hypothetical protein